MSLTILIFPSVGGDQKGGANFPNYPHIPLHGRGSKGWGETSLTILIFPSVGGNLRGGANFPNYPHIPLRGRGSKGWGDI
ncbi:MAG: hypothetical protein LBP62_08610 [Clostridiales bacterium]|nr:hypothetical protein [Clostridiales bacterium]